MTTTRSTELPGAPFLSVMVKRYGHRDHLEWEVTYRDGTPDRFHQGLWPNSINDRQGQQLSDAAERFRQHESRSAPAENRVSP